MLEFLSLLVTGAGGGLIGGIGGLISKFIEQKNTVELEKLKLEQTKLNNEFQLAYADKQNDALKLEMEMGLKAVEISASVDLEKAGYEALKTNYEFDKASYATGDEARNSILFIFVDFARGITRPLLTWGLDLAVLILTVYLLYILKDQLPTLAQKEGVALLKDVVTTLLFLASTSTAYWYSSRNHSSKNDS